MKYLIKNVVKGKKSRMFALQSISPSFGRSMDTPNKMKASWGLSFQVRFESGKAKEEPLLRATRVFKRFSSVDNKSALWLGREIFSLSMRKKKCEEIGEQLKESDLILLRAARGSGKTVFCELLQRHLLERGEENVFIIPLLGASNYGSFLKIFKEATKCKDAEDGFQDLREMSLSKREGEIFLIFDEVQILFSEEFNKFWETIKALIQKQKDLRGIKVFMVSSYTPSEVGAINTPTQLRDAFSLQIPFLYCSREEMDELNERFNKLNPEAPRLQIGQEVKEGIFEHTGGHIGLISEIYSVFFHHFRTTGPHSPAVSQEELFHYLFSNDMQRSILGYRTFSGLPELTDAHKNALKSLIMTETGELGVKDFDGNVLLHLLKLGILDYTGFNSGLVTWSFPMMREFVIPFLYSSRTRPKNDEWRGKSLNEFLLEALRRMSPKHLKAGIGESTRYLREQQVRLDFFRVLTSMVPESVVIFSEMGQDANINDRKRVDFYLNKEHQWPIELVVEDSDVKEHQGRFNPGGKYAKAKMKNWACLHFVSSKFANHLRDIPGAWRIQLDQDCTTAFVNPWLKDSANDPGRRGDVVRISLRGDFLTDALHNPITIDLNLLDGNRLVKDETLQDVPTKFGLFEKAVKRQLGIREDQQISMQYKENRKMVELSSDEQILGLSDRMAVRVTIK